MGRKNNQRANLNASREFPPEFGARHPVVFDRQIVNFFGDLDQAWSQILPEREIYEPLQVNHELAEPALSARAEPVIHYRPQFRLYDDRDKIGMTVLEKRLSAEHARRKRLRWNRNDVGRIRGRIEDEIGRLDLPEGPIEAQLTGIVRVGDPASRAGERKLAAIVDQESPVAELLVREHEITVNGLGVALKGFRYPYSDYVPKMTLGRLYKEVTPPDIDSCVQAVNELLPLRVQLGSLQFFAQQEI